MYLADAIVRARVRPPSTVPADDFAERALSGYEGAVTLAAALVIPAIFLGLTGLRVVLALLAEGEILFLAGLGIPPVLAALAGDRRLCGLARSDWGSPTWPIVGSPARTWTPTALLAAAIFYVNRALKRPGLQYSYAAARPAAPDPGIRSAARLARHRVAGLALALFEFGFWIRLREFRLQGYGIAALSWAVLLSLNTVDPQAHPWLTLGAAALGSWLVTAQMIAIRRLSETEHATVRDIASAAGTFFACGADLAGGAARLSRAWAGSRWRSSASKPAAPPE